ncbi:MAG TPA: hypothetical protein VH062_08020 [Polyangiaceae bacterium]|nr:hypothetical protein [Polyangiaceae bacterium]
MRAHDVGKVVGGQRTAMLIDEHGLGRARLAAVLEPPRERVRDTVAEAPPPGMVRLVLVERHCLVLEVEVAPLERRHLAAPHPLAVQKAVERPVLEGHRGAAE